VSTEGTANGSETFLADQPTGRAAWIFRNRKEMEILDLLKDASDEDVEEALDVRQGVKTGADEIFVVESPSAGLKSPANFVNKGEFKLERQALIPVFRNRDLRRWAAVPVAYLIYPYDRKRREVFDWDTLKNRFPEAGKYLSAHKQRLSSRKSLRGKKWYELIEPRVDSIISGDDKLFVAELSLRPVFAVSDLDATAILGGTGGGSVLLINNKQYESAVLLAYLNSVVAEWFFRQVSPIYRGNYVALEQKNMHLLPLPRFLKDPDVFAFSELDRIVSGLLLKLGDRPGPIDPRIRGVIQQTEEQIDSLIMEALNLTTSQANYIRDKVFHVKQELV
jgi:hypothetical protein